MEILNGIYDSEETLQGAPKETRDGIVRATYYKPDEPLLKITLLWREIGTE